MSDWRNLREMMERRREAEDAYFNERREIDHEIAEEMERLAGQGYSLDEINAELGAGLIRGIGQIGGNQ